MKNALTSQEMKICDRNTFEYFGVPQQVLMERASLCVVSHIEKWIGQRSCGRKYRALILSGVGNNGGDGVCIARLLKQRGISPTVCVIGDYTKCTDNLLMQLKILEKYGTSTDTFSNVRDNKSAATWDIIVDAMFGIGLSRPLTGDYLAGAQYINACKKERGDDLLVVSVDMPSGINADDGRVLGDAVKADMTVTFNHVKRGQILYPGCEYVGQLLVDDAGITDESFLGKEPTAFFYDEEPMDILPQRKKDGNKGTNGKLLVIAGSKDISGACILCASAAFKAGCGMVKIFTAQENAETVKTLLPEAMLVTYGDYEPVQDKLRSAYEWSSAAVIGPGIGTALLGEELVKQTLSEYKKDLIVDADAINIIAANSEYRTLLENYSREGKRLILTPHLGEFARLFDRDIKDCKAHITEYPSELARNLHCTVICKDARSVVAAGNEKRIYINVSGNDGMATAGSGDVLSGILGAMLPYGLSAFETACIGAYLHGLAGDAAAAAKGRYSMVASDIANGIEEVLKDGSSNA